MTGRRLVGRVAPLVAAVGALAIAPAASAAALPVLPDCSNSYYGGSVRPSTWSSGCLGGSFNTERLSWSRWRSGSAVGRGRHRYNDCDPSCAGGSIRSYRVTLRLSRVRTCSTEDGRRMRMFTRIRYRTTAPGTRPGTFEVDCH